MRSLALFLTIVFALTAAPQAQRRPAASARKETRTYRGLLTALEDDELTIELSDKRALILKRDKSTNFNKPGIKPGDTVSVEITDDEKGYLYALNVTLEKAGEMPDMERRGPRRMPTNPDNEPGVAPAVAPRATTVNSGENVDPDGGGPPKLKRGVPAPRKQTSTTADEPPPITREEAARISRFPSGEVASSAGDEAPVQRGNYVRTRGDGEVPFIERARETAYTFVETLPNYTVKQVTTRYQNERAIDNLTCDLIVENGKERYQNLMRNGKLMKEKAEESGSWSSGEFASTLQDIFSSSTNATFKPKGSTTIFQRSAMLFDFTVEQPNSHWTIRTQQEQYLPAYQGTLWIDKETARILRIEMQARKIPSAFPLDRVESAVDYNFVKIGTASVLLPVHADVLSCERGSRQCSHNAIDFRNYKKFGAESNVTFTP